MRFLDVLMDEHRGFSAMLDVLDAVAGRLERGADVPMAMLVDVVDFFENFTDQHHEREEEMLFPLLAKHGIGPDQTTADLKFTVKTVNCVGACAMAPVMIVGEKYWGNAKPARVTKYLGKGSGDDEN